VIILSEECIHKNIKPVVKITDSYKHLCLFGAVELDGERLFREDDRLKYQKEIHYRYPKCYLIPHNAPQHYKSQKVGHYFEKHKDAFVFVWLTTASPESWSWNIGIYQRIAGMKI
jgi:hypothetical protein